MVNFNELISTNDRNLFYVIERGKNGYYAESLENGNVKYISDLTNDVKYLNDGILYTYSDCLEISNLFLEMKSNRTTMPSKNANKETIKSFFRSIVPEYNEKRTLIKTLRKFIHFYNLIETHDEQSNDSLHLYGDWKTEYKSSALINKKIQYA